MANTLYRTGISYTIAAVPPQPARPAYDEVRTYQLWRPPQAAGWYYPVVASEVVYASGGGTAGTEGTDQLVMGGKAVWLPAYPGGWVTYTYVIHHAATPAVAGSPSQRVDVPPAGWTSFAHSIAFIRGGGEATFNAAVAISGAAVGLSSSLSPTVGYGHIKHGFVLTDAQALSIRTGAALGDYTDTTEFKIELAGGLVSLLMDDVEVASEASTYLPGETLHLSAVLYGAGDSIENPTLVEIVDGVSSGVLPGLSAFTTEDGDAAGSYAVLPSLRATSYQVIPDVSYASLPGLRAFSSYSVAVGDSPVAMLPGLVAGSYGGLIEITPINNSIAVLPDLMAASVGLVGTVGDSSGELPALEAFSAYDTHVGVSAATLPGLQAFSYDEPNDFAVMLEAVAFDFPMVGTAEYVQDARDTFEIDVAMSGSIESEVVDARDTFIIGVSLVPTSDEIVDARDVFWFDVPLIAKGAEADVDCWSVVLQGYGSTTYSNYPFNSFARIGGRFYGGADGGLYELDGDDDAGAPIRAFIDLGKRDLGLAQRKNVTEAYLGMSGTGHLFLKVIAEGEEYVYPARSYDEEMQQQRIQLGKGLRSNYVTLQLMNDENGCDFEIDTLEFAPVVSTRRI